MGSSRALCAVCRLAVPLTRLGLIGFTARSVTDALVPDTPPVQAPDLMSPVSALNPSCPTHKILKKIPRTSQQLATSKLATIIDEVVKDNSAASWDCLVHFPVCCLRALRRGGHRISLAFLTNQLFGEESDPEPVPNQQPRRPPQTTTDHHNNPGDAGSPNISQTRGG